MGHGTQTAFVEVHGGDAIDAEDAARAFGKSLSEIEDLTVDFSYFAPEPASGAKGVLDEVLRITLEYPWPLAAPLVAEKIKSLCLKASGPGPRDGRRRRRGDQRRTDRRAADAPARTASPPQGMTRPAVRRALLVGIGSYADSHFAALPCTRTDVETFRAVLVDPKIGSFDEVTTLFDPEVSALRQGLRDFLEHSTKDELTMVYISGHGCREPKTAEFHFIARDTRHNEFESAVSAGFLNDLLDDCPARQRVLVIDCCNSGGFTTGFATTKAASAQGAAPLATRGVYVLASSQSAEASFPGENPGDPSIFTGELIDALRSGAGDQDRDGRVAVDELYHHVHRVLTARESGRRQTPVMSAVGVAGAIYLASAPLIRSVARSRDRTGTHLDQPRVVSHRSEWERLISYYRDCLQAENADAARLSFAARSTAAVFLGGPERFLSGNGMDDDGALPAPRR